MKPMRTIKSVLIIISVLFLACSCGTKRNEDRSEAFTSNIIFPYQDEHVHGSTMVQLPNGDVLSAWFQGSGERWADDVRIMGSRLVKGDTSWSQPFLMADVPAFPDINPILFLDNDERLWLMWYPVLANQWETSIPMYRISENYGEPGPPIWSWQDVLFVKVGDKTERGIQPNDNFVKEVKEQLSLYEEYIKTSLIPSAPDSLKGPLLKEWEKYKVKMDSLSKGENMIRGGRIKDSVERLVAARVSVNTAAGMAD